MAIQKPLSSKTFSFFLSSFSVFFPQHFTTINWPNKSVQSGSKMAVSVQNSLWDRVAELTKVAQQKGVDPLLWAIQLSSNLNSAGVALPSVELANLLVSQICWDNNEPVSWKFLEKALMLSIVPPILVLALLTTRFILVCFCSLPLSFFFVFLCMCLYFDV